MTDKCTALILFHLFYDPFQFMDKSIRLLISLNSRDVIKKNPASKITQEHEMYFNKKFLNIFLSHSPSFYYMSACHVTG